MSDSQYLINNVKDLVVFQLEKFSIHSNKGFRGTVMNETYHSINREPLKIRLQSLSSEINIYL